MDRKNQLLILSLSVILVVSLLTVMANNLNPLEGKLKGGVYKPGVSQEADKAVNQARKVYQEKKKLEIDFTDGPCLTNDLLPDWALDIAHSPRKNIDDLLENQCQAHLEGRAQQVIEMDPEGNVIQIR